jgi:hypothetical protein
MRKLGVEAALRPKKGFFAMLSKESSMRSTKLARTALALFLGGTVLAACATGPIYRPRGPGDNVGYTDQRLTQNRYRVTFTGSSGTRRELVEDSLLRRSAEVTLQNGFSHFVFDQRDTDATGFYRDSFRPRTSLGFGFGSSRFFGPGPWYWSSFGFGGGYPYGEFYAPLPRYEAYAEIVMLNPQQAAGEPDAIDAREVLASLTPPPPAR